MDMKRAGPCKHFLLSLLSFAAVGSSIGCQSVPRARFDSYTESFTSVKANADELYLRASIIVDSMADRPEKEGSVGQKVKELEARRAALDSRLAAIEMIGRYNRVLTQLAAGQSAEALKGDLSGLKQDLSSFNMRQLASVLEKATPYMGVVTQGIALFEDAVKKRKFKQAVDAAQQPLLGVLDILALDADSLEELIVQEIRREQDPYRAQVDSYGGRIFKRLKDLRPGSDVDVLLSRHNQARLSMNRDLKPIPHQPSAAAGDPSAADLDLLMTMVAQAEVASLSFSRIEARISAQRAVFREYKRTLDATRKAFVALASDMEQGHYVATAEFVRQAAELRKSMMMLREVR